MTLSFPQADAIIDQLTTRIHELIGTDYRDAAIDAASRAEAQAERAEAAADNAEVGIRDGAVTRPKLAPEVREELDGKAPAGHEHSVEDITDLPLIDANSNRGDTIVQRDSSGRIMLSDAVSDSQAVTKRQLDAEVGAKADASHTHSLADISGVPSSASASALGDTIVIRNASGYFSVVQPASDSHAAPKGYVDSRIQLVTDWPASPTPGVLYLMEEG